MNSIWSLYQQILTDDELWELSYKIFGDIEGSDDLLRPLDIPDDEVRDWYKLRNST
jgi:hypothetical protein